MKNSQEVIDFYNKCKFDGSLRFDTDKTAIYTRDYEGTEFWATIDGNDFKSVVTLYRHEQEEPYTISLDASSRFEAEKRICRDFELVDTRDWMFKQ